jgi:hypothetical protein
MFVASCDGRYHDLLTRQQGAVRASSRITGRKTLNQALLFWELGSSEETMTTRLAVIAFTLLFAVVSLTSRAEAGASASAPSKNSRSSQLAAQQTNHNTAKNDVGITEYSSSSARNRSH